MGVCLVVYVSLLGGVCGLVGWYLGMGGWCLGIVGWCLGVGWVLYGYGWVAFGGLMGGNMFNVGHYMTISMITIQAFKSILVSNVAFQNLKD